MYGSLDYIEKASERIMHRLINEIKNPSNLKCFQKMQLEILSGILHSERQIRKADNQKQALKHKIRELTQNSAIALESKNELKNLGSRIELLDAKILSHQNRINLLRLLGSSIAHCFVDRNTLLNLGQNQPPGGFLIDKKGLELEMRVFRKLCSVPNSMALLNDITNCLRIGDIISIINGYVIVIEAKSSKRDRLRVEDRQILRMKETTNFITTQIDKRPGHEKRIIEIDQSDKHNWEEVQEVLMGARTKGFSQKIVEGCIAYVAYRTDCFDVDEALSMTIFPWPKEPVLTFGSLCRHIEGILVRPLPLFQLETSAILDILFNRIKFITVLNLVSLTKQLKKRGLKARFGKPPNKFVKVIQRFGTEYLENIDHKIQVRDSNNTWFLVEDQPLLRLIYECLSVDAIAHDLASSFEAVRKIKE